MADVLDFEVRMKMAEKDIQELNAQIRSIANNANKAGQQMDDAFSKVGKVVGSVFATAQLVNFAKEVVNVRKEIESYEISFRTLLGSQPKADALFGSLREFAVKTPMQLGDLAKGAQTLLGFGVEAEKIMPVLKQIGDISMGNADKFGSLTLAFAQMSSSGKLMGQDLLQMINAGFNPLQEISKKTGKSIGDLKQEMEQGAISTEMVAEAFKSATSEGGMFYGMLEKQSEGIAGAISNLQGAWEEVLNNIGERSEGIIVSTIKGATKIVESYDAIINAILPLISAYGAYKAAVIATMALDQAKLFVTNIRLIAMCRKEMGLLTAAQQAFNTATKANPWGLALAGIAAVGMAIYSYINRTNEATKAQEEFNKAVGEQSSANVTKIEKMSKAWNELGDDLQAKERYIRDNKSAFEELGVAINSVVEAENLLVANKEKFIEAQQAKARAQLYQEKANELIAKQIENEAKIAELNPYVNRTQSRQVGRGQYQTYNVKIKNPRITELENENADLQQQIDELLTKSLSEETTAKGVLNGEGATTKEIQNINKEITSTLAKIKETKQAIADLRSGKTESTDILGDIAKKEKDLDDFNKKLETLRGKTEKPTTFAQEAAEKAQQMEDENYLNRLRHEAELAKVRTNNLEEYYKKQQEIIDSEYDLRVIAIEKERDLALKKANREDIDAINASFDLQIKAADADWQLETQKNNQAREANIYKQRLELYRRFAEEYVRIEQERVEREKEINKLAKKGEITQDEATQRIETSTNVALAEKTALQAEIGLTAEEVSSIISGVVVDTVTMSLDHIRSQLPFLKVQLEELKNAGADPEVIANLTAKISVMETALKKAKVATTEVEASTKKGAKEGKGDWKIVAMSLGAVSDAIDEVNNAFGDMIGEAGKTAMQVMQTTLNATMGILGAIEATSQGSSEAIKRVEQASLIIAIISAAVQIITAITNAILKNYSAQAMYEKSMEKYDKQLDSIDHKWKKINAKNAQKKGSAYWLSLAESAEQYTQKLGALNRQLDETRDRLDEINSNQSNEDKISKKEQEVIESQREIESEKIDNENELYELRQKLLEEFATTSLKDFSQSMAESMVEGFSKGLNGINESWKDTLKQLQRDMLTRQLALKLEDLFKDAFDSLSEYTANGELTNEEMESFYASMEQSAANAQAIGEQYRKVMAEMGLLDDSIDAESKGFQTMSQDTADELNGRFTALQISGANIEYRLGEQIEIDKQALLFSQQISENIELATQIANNQLNELRQISKNTQLLEDTNRELKQIKEHTSRL